MAEMTLHHYESLNRGGEYVLLTVRGFLSDFNFHLYTSLPCGTS